MKYSSLAAYAAHLGRALDRMPVAKARGLRLAADQVAVVARGKLGNYQAGWPSLKPETIARKATGDSPLLETGAMRGTIAVAASAEKATISAAGPAVYQEFGTSKMPPRPFLGPALHEAHPGPAIAEEISINLGTS